MTPAMDLRLVYLTPAERKRVERAAAQHQKRRRRSAAEERYAALNAARMERWRSDAAACLLRAEPVPPKPPVEGPTYFMGGDYA